MLSNSVLAIKRDLISLRFNTISTVRHFINSRKLARLNSERFKKLHFGCGSDYKKGWLNLDVNHIADYWVDVRNPIKIPDNSAELIYSSHMVEHLEHHELMSHLKECHRILKQGGILRLGVPDFASIIKNYGDNDFLEKHRNVVSGEMFGLPDELICYMDLMNRAFYEFGQHKIVLDEQKMTNLLVFSGFERSNISKVEFDKEYDLAVRMDATFYMQAVKAW